MAWGLYKNARSATLSAVSSCKKEKAFKNFSRKSKKAVLSYYGKYDILSRWSNRVTRCSLPKLEKEGRWCGWKCLHFRI